jgi:4-amino-4-deoxy-L-arabinose transferase-like glycosyltransferase
VTALMEVQVRVSRRPENLLNNLSRYSEQIVLLGLLCSGLVNLDWGLPESWPSDEVWWIVDSMLKNNTTNTGWFVYPNLMMNASYLVCRFLTVPVLSHLGWDQTYAVAYSTRLVSVGFYLLTALFIAKTVALLFDLKRAPLALLFVGLIGALNHHAHLATVSSSLFFGTALSMFFFVRTCKTRRESDLYLSVAAISLAVGAKYNGAFLFAAIPVLWRWVFPKFSLGILLRPMAISAAIVPIVFLLTTPYALLDSQTFLKDIYNDFSVEGPAFAASEAMGFVQAFIRSYEGFFSIWVLAIMVTILLATIVWFLMLWIGRRRTDTTWNEVQPLHVAMLALGAAFLASLLVIYRVGNYQSRHYLPGALVFATMFLIVVYHWRAKLADRHLLIRSGAIGLGASIILLSSINTYIHIWVFSSSAKSQTLTMVQNALNADPQTRFGAITYSERSPFQRGVVDASTDFFATNVSAYDVESWNEYLGIIAQHFQQSRPKYIVFEDIILSWPVFLPKKYAGDYGKRFDYPNPGPTAWNAMLESLGYRRSMVIGNAVLPRLLRGVIGQNYLYTAEGVGGKVYVYERTSADSTR